MSGHFRVNLIDLMKENGVSEIEIAEQVQCSPATITSYIYDKRVPRLHRAEAIAKYFKLDPPWIIFVEPEMEEENESLA